MYEYRASLRRVVDGDTYDLDIDLGFHVKLENLRFRLYGADTPEKYGPNAVPEGETASAFVRALLEAQPDWFTVRTVKDKQGKYGRWLADIDLQVDEEGVPFPDGMQSLSAYLVAKGYAQSY